MTDSSLDGCSLFRVTITEHKSVLVAARNPNEARKSAMAARPSPGETPLQTPFLQTGSTSVSQAKEDGLQDGETVLLPGATGFETSTRPRDVLAKIRAVNEGRRRLTAKMPVELEYSVERATDGNGYPILELRKPAVSEPLLSSFQVPKLLEAEGAVWVIREENDDRVVYHQRGW